ncbi:MAG TPA: hypothetical protein PKY56_03950 [Candidatus Kapabacteria bacterium]|nr:hypothetical protein [Candidatus Kapabacteria bacterium]
MEKTLVIWIIGGNSTGKTTLARNIHKFFQNIATPTEKVISVGDFYYTEMSKYSCNVGDLLKSQCAGCDTLGTKQQIINCFEYVVDRYPVVVLEGIMATGTWIEFLKRDDTIVFTILLNVTPETNFSMVSKRRAIKKGISQFEVEVTEKTRENMSSKLRGFMSLYERMKPKSDYSLIIEIDGLTIGQVFTRVEVFLKKIILQK